MKRICASVAGPSPAVADLGPLDRHRPDPGLDRALRPMAVPHDAVAAVRQASDLPHHGQKGFGFGLDRLRQQPAGAFAQQRSVSGSSIVVGLTEGG